MEPELLRFNKLPGDAHAVGPESQELKENLQLMKKTAIEGKMPISMLVLSADVGKKALLDILKALADHTCVYA